ncbi:heparinase II/III family protein [Vibrio natriegens]|uniref:heparinase II/III domain-containing protein n=1 Tax=Vibrio natriegens TaxID=691 RepID=UPI0021E725C7|nr:heparinase II/III family protein [Vibrio natriegens]UYI50069.1 heparinase II/III family protein [Vibrio natriegens]
MLSLHRKHDFQLFTSPRTETAIVNPPSFNWPQDDYANLYDLELIHLDGEQKWNWSSVQSPHQLDFELEHGKYRWRVTCLSQNLTSDWVEFNISAQTDTYLAPTAEALFAQCADKTQFLMYFDEDIETVRNASQGVKEKLMSSIADIDVEKIQYPNHYRRGHEEGKRTAIANVRNWIDRDLIALTLLYKVWGDTDAGIRACQLLLRLSEWSPEGPASLLRPCTWGDEVGLSLARNLYLAYHWLSPVLTDDERAFVRPLLVRLAFQMEERLEQDQFKQFPGHSHTSRLPAYLGVAALTLHKEFDKNTCERWLTYALMIYRGVLPFYGGKDGSWAEGPFYSSSYSKWHHPFFLSVERLSGFSFYDHPFYKNYVNFAMDFVATQERIHPFGDGFWCQRDGKEWPGFFAQNPLRVYAQRFGSQSAIALNKTLETEIDTYQLHLLDVIPTTSQIACAQTVESCDENIQHDEDQQSYYAFAGLGKISSGSLSTYYRASQFGNSSHRHADQGNFALVESGTNILTPSGSYGYRFGSKHHSLWTRTTQAHNLPLINGIGQKLDCQSATASVITQIDEDGYTGVMLDVTMAYDGCKRFIRTLIQVADKGLVVHDHVILNSAAPLQWRLHTPLQVILGTQIHTLFGETSYQDSADKVLFQIEMLSKNAATPELVEEVNDADGYYGSVESDAQKDIKHIEWKIESNTEHNVLLTCVSDPIDCQYIKDKGIFIKCNGKELIVKTPMQLTADSKLFSIK